MTYYSDTVLGEIPQTLEVISDRAWAGIRRAIKHRFEDASFAKEFPEICPDGTFPVEMDYEQFFDALNAEMRPSITWHPDLECEYPAPGEHPSSGRTERSNAPPVLAILDLIQFCYQHVAEAKKAHFHSFYCHYHFDFDKEAGQDQFRKKINFLFARNGIAYELLQNGTIRRIISEVVENALPASGFATGDPTLDQLLSAAVHKFRSPDPEERSDSLDKLWDAWERVKTLMPGKDKKTSIAELLDAAAAEPKFRDELEEEARKLTGIGNKFSIRHSETTQTPLNEPEHVDYLFHRLYALISLILAKKD